MLQGIPCCYCGELHSQGSCNKITQVNNRRQVLKETGCCFVCTKKGGHVSKNCRYGGHCSTCGGRHHTSICSRVKPEKGKEQSKPSQVLHNPNHQLCLQKPVGVSYYKLLELKYRI